MEVGAGVGVGVGKVLQLIQEEQPAALQLPSPKV